MTDRRERGRAGAEYIDIPGRGEVSPGAPEIGREDTQDFRRLEWPQPPARACCAAGPRHRPRLFGPRPESEREQKDAHIESLVRHRFLRASIISLYVSVVSVCVVGGRLCSRLVTIELEGTMETIRYLQFAGPPGRTVGQYVLYEDPRYVLRLTRTAIVQVNLEHTYRSCVTNVFGSGKWNRTWRYDC